MKKLQIILFLSFLTIHVWSGNEFSKDSTLWIVSDYENNCFQPDQWKISFSTYLLHGDTLIEGNNCKKLFWEGSYCGAIKEEEKKVWYLGQNAGEEETLKVLLYDFTKEKGDIVPFDYTIFFCNSDVWFTKEPQELTVTNVSYQYGRKIMTLSNGDVWIEGIGSIFGFWGIYLQHPTNGITHSLSLDQVVVDKQSIYMSGQIVNPDYKSTFLTEGKTWYIDNGTTFSTIKLGAPVIREYYTQYPIIKDDKVESFSYLFDVNGSIIWSYNNDILLYNFNLAVGDEIGLRRNYTNHPLVNGPPEWRTYTVTKIDNIENGGKILKRFFLDGPIPYIWIEGIGSTYGLIYMPEYPPGEIYEAPKTVLTCCYENDEPLYHNPDYQDCTHKGSNIDSPFHDLYSLNNNNLTINNCAENLLNIYTINGKEIYNRILQSDREEIALNTSSQTILLCKLVDKKGNTTTFKINIQ